MAKREKRTQGTCNACKQLVELERDGRTLAGHRKPFVWQGGVPVQFEFCRGSGKQCQEQRAVDRAKRRKLTEAAQAKWISPLRDEAACALDSVLEQRNDMRARIPELVKAACAIYCTRFDVRVGRGVFEPLQVIPRAMSRVGEERRVDAYCRFCRVLVEHNKQRRLVGQRQNSHPHVVICALEVLAGIREPLGPDVPWRLAEPSTEAA